MHSCQRRRQQLQPLLVPSFYRRRLQQLLLLRRQLALIHGCRLLRFAASCLATRLRCCRNLAEYAELDEFCGRRLVVVGPGRESNMTAAQHSRQVHDDDRLSSTRWLSFQPAGEDSDFGGFYFIWTLHCFADN